MAGKFELLRGKSGKFHFNLKSSNGQIVLSSQMYKSIGAAKNGIESVRQNASIAERFDRRTTKKEQPYFVLKAGNGMIIGSSESYNSERSMENGIRSVQKNAPDAELVDNTKGLPGK